MSHLAFVTAAYVISAVGIGGLAGWILFDQHMQKRTIEELESRGIRRRSARGTRE